MIPEDILIDGLNLLTYTNPYAKIFFLDELFFSFEEYQRRENKKGNISYIDIDTLLTSIIKSGDIQSIKNFDVNVIAKHNLILERVHNRGKSLNIYLPSYNDIPWILEEILKNIQNTSLIVFDSLSTFYTLFDCKDIENFKRTIGKLSHYLYFLIMILIRHCLWCKIPLLVTNLINNKKDSQTKGQPNKRISLYCKTQIFAYFNHIQDFIINFCVHPTLQDKIIRIENHQIRTNILANSKL